MNNRMYRVLVAEKEGGLLNAAKGWNILESTVREFSKLETNDDNTLGNIGAINVKRRGWVALAYREE